jgi:hypothetical protein
MWIPGFHLGRVSSQNEQYVFVKYEPELTQLGWDGTTAQATLVTDVAVIFEETYEFFRAMVEAQE